MEQTDTAFLHCNISSSVQCSVPSFNILSCSLPLWQEKETNYWRVNYCFLKIFFDFVFFSDNFYFFKVCKHVCTL